MTTVPQLIAEEASISASDGNLVVPHNEHNPITLQDFARVDEDLAVVESFTDDAILADADSNDEYDHEIEMDDDDEGELDVAVSLKDVKTGMAKLRRLFGVH